MNCSCTGRRNRALPVARRLETTWTHDNDYHRSFVVARFRLEALRCRLRLAEQLHAGEVWCDRMGCPSGAALPDARSVHSGVCLLRQSVNVVACPFGLRHSLHDGPHQSKSSNDGSLQKSLLARHADSHSRAKAQHEAVLALAWLRPIRASSNQSADCMVVD